MKNKRMYMKWFAGVLFAAVAGLANAANPNIVFVLCDDLGYGEIQCLNPERGKIPTPGVDRLASEGMIFTDAHSGSSVCTPTRYGLLTGRFHLEANTRGFSWTRRKWTCSS